MARSKMFNLSKQKISFIISFLFLLLFHRTAFGNITVIQGDNGSGNYIPNSGHFSFNKIRAADRCNAVNFTIVNNGNSPAEFAGEKITLVNADDSGELDFSLNMNELTDYIQPNGNTNFTLRFISDTTDGRLKKALVTLSFAGEEQPFVFYVSCIAKTKVTWEYTEVGTHYWQFPSNGNALITLVGGGGGGGGGASTYHSETSYADGRGGYGGRAGDIVISQYDYTKESLWTIIIGNGGGGGPGTSGESCNRVAGSGIKGGSSIINSGTTTIFYADGGTGGGGGSGPGNSYGGVGNPGYNGAPGGRPGGEQCPGCDSGHNGGNGAPTAGGGGGSAATADENHCRNGGQGGNGGPGYCKIEWIGFLE